MPARLRPTRAPVGTRACAPQNQLHGYGLVLPAFQLFPGPAAALPRRRPTLDFRHWTLDWRLTCGALKHLEKLGIVRETPCSKYGRLDAYDRYLKLLNAESAGTYHASPLILPNPVQVPLNQLVGPTRLHRLLLGAG